MGKSKYNDNLKLIYVLKIGTNSKGEGMYEFIFSEDETKIEPEKWYWDVVPASNNAEPPESEYVDLVVNFKTKQFSLFCLHESVDREYMHGYHTIHALAYELDDDEMDEDGFDSYENMIDTNIDGNDEPPLLVFHYGMTLKQVSEMLYPRQIILQNNQFVEAEETKIEN